MAMEINDIVGGRGGSFLGGGDGGGMGVLLGLLLGRGGLLGDNGNRDGGCITQADLNGKAIGDLKGEIKDAQAELQLGLCGAESSINATTLAAANQLQNGQTALLLQNANQTAALMAAVAAVDTNVDRTACVTQNAIKDSERNILEVINQNRIRDLEQQLTVSQLRESEQRQINREDVNSHNVTVQVNQQQAQAQLQFQAINHALNSLCAGFSQIARATNSNVIVGNTGATATGAQTANPTNVNA